MSKAVKELCEVFWTGCKETPKGMFLPFAMFWRTAIHNPILSHQEDHQSTK